MTTICPICYDEVERLISLPCSHEFCRDCLVKYIETRISGDSPIFCPYDSCTIILDEDVVGNILPNLDKYKEYLKTIEMLKSRRASICPNCKGIRKKGKKTNKVYCQMCATDFCFICKEAHDSYIICENEGKLNETLQEMRTIYGSDLVKLCPFCKVIIYKEEGCSSMKCKYCKTKFCWECLLTKHDVAKLDNHMCHKYDGYGSDSSDNYRSGSDYSFSDDSDSDSDSESDSESEKVVYKTNSGNNY